ncbi:MAG: sensor histidine kinase [Chloroflexi bacterium]|nr:sensor histidine kinase [Chloroflexota bacterium]
MLVRIGERLRRLAIRRTARYLEEHAADVSREWLDRLEEQNPRYARSETGESGEQAGLKNLELLIAFMLAETAAERAAQRESARQFGQTRARLKLSQAFGLEELLHAISLLRLSSHNAIGRMLARRLWVVPPWDILAAEDRLDEALDTQMTAMSEAYLAVRDEVIRQREEELEARNRQLTILNQEMLHRIRNNLQTVADLFSLELARGIRKPYEEHLTECVVRLKSIAAVHDLLSADNLADTDIKQLAEKVASIAVRSLSRPQCTLSVEVRGDSITLPSKKATSFALVLNELISNALEHGFRDRDRGSILIDLGLDDSEVVAVVKDDGVGLAPDFVLEDRAQTGLHVAVALTRSDLGGDLSLVDGEGATATVRFKR